MPYYRNILDDMLRKIEKSMKTMYFQNNPVKNFKWKLKTILYVLKAYRNGKTKYNQIMITELKLVVTSFGY